MTSRWTSHACARVAALLLIPSLILSMCRLVSAEPLSDEPIDSADLINIDLDRTILPTPTPLPPQALNETAYTPAMATIQGMPGLEGHVPIATRTRTIDCQTTTGPLRVVMIETEPTSRVAALVFVPEWWGVDQALTEEMTYWASHGFRAVAVDLHRGRTPANRREAAAAASRIDVKAAATLVAAALAVAAGRTADAPTSRPLEVGLIGMGFGSQIALHAAALSSPKALVLLYGEPLLDAAVLKDIKATAQLFFADRDTWVTPAKTAAFTRALTEAGVVHEFFHFDVLPGFYQRPVEQIDRNYAVTAREEMRRFLTRELLHSPTDATGE